MEWSAKLNIRVMEPDPNSENVAAVSQSSVGSDCKYRSYFDSKRRSVTYIFFLTSLSQSCLQMRCLFETILPEALPFVS